MKRRNLILPALLVLVLLAAVTAALPAQRLLAQSGNSWYVQYYSDPNWSVPSVGMYSSYIDFNWGTTPPAPGMPSTNWTATHDEHRLLLRGNYTFSALADDEISMQIDGVTYINTMGAGMSGKTVTLILPMTEGNHNIVVRYRQYTEHAYVYLTWIYGISTATPTPPPASTPACDPWWSCSCPTQATSVTTQYGDYTSCIQQNIHQSNCFVSDGQWDSPNMGSIEMEPQIQVWGRVHAGPTPVHAAGMQRGAGAGQLLEDCGRLVLPQSVPGADADADARESSRAHAGPAASGPRMGFEREWRVGVTMGH